MKKEKEAENIYEYVLFSYVNEERVHIIGFSSLNLLADYLIRFGMDIKENPSQDRRIMSFFTKDKADSVQLYPEVFYSEKNMEVHKKAYEQIKKK